MSRGAGDERRGRQEGGDRPGSVPGEHARASHDGADHRGGHQEPDSVLGGERIEAQQVQHPRGNQRDDAVHGAPEPAEIVAAPRPGGKRRTCRGHDHPVGPRVHRAWEHSVIDRAVAEHGEGGARCHQAVRPHVRRGRRVRHARYGTVRSKGNGRCWHGARTERGWRRACVPRGHTLGPQTADGPPRHDLRAAVWRSRVAPPSHGSSRRSWCGRARPRPPALLASLALLPYALLSCVRAPPPARPPTGRRLAARLRLADLSPRGPRPRGRHGAALRHDAGSA